MVIETFIPPATWVRQMNRDEPSCFNGTVSIHRYRVTAERIDEPVEVLAARLQDLWDHTDNHHHVATLEQAAKKLGVELRGAYGSKVRKAVRP